MNKSTFMCHASDYKKCFLLLNTRYKDVINQLFIMSFFCENKQKQVHNRALKNYSNVKSAESARKCTQMFDKD